MSDCIFCKIVAGEISATFVHETDDVVAFEDLNPAAPTHVLIIPKRHISTVNDVSDDDAELMGKLTLAARRVAADKGLSDSGYRLVTNVMAGAGQTVFHIHLHVLGGRPMTWPPG